MLLFIHGGGWVTESIDNYERICARLANANGQYVVAANTDWHRKINSRQVWKIVMLLQKRYILEIFYVKYKTRKHYFDRRQCRGKSLRSIIFDGKRPRRIHAKQTGLIYPATYNDYTENSPFVSVKKMDPIIF